jgi:hypothetical protein
MEPAYNGLAAALSGISDDPRKYPPTWGYVVSLLLEIELLKAQLEQLKDPESTSNQLAEAFNAVIDNVGLRNTPFQSVLESYGDKERGNGIGYVVGAYGSAITHKANLPAKGRKAGVEAKAATASFRTKIAQSIAVSMKREVRGVTAPAVLAEIKQRFEAGDVEVVKRFGKDGKFDGTTERTISRYLYPPKSKTSL